MKTEYRIHKVTIYKGVYGYAVQERIGGYVPDFWRDALPEPFGTRKQAEDALQELRRTTGGTI